MKKEILISAILLLGTQLISAQTYNPYYASISNQVSQSNINNNLQEFQNIGIKTTGSAKLQEALTWLKNKYSGFGYTSSQISEQSFTYQGKTSSNLIITKTGTLYPNKYVIICGHYDTLNGPGTNDNGSGISVILEVARLLQNIDNQYSIKFINFAGEEQGLIGSQEYVNNIVNGTNPKMDIKLVFNIDEVGGVAGETNNTVTCERDENNSPSSNNAASNSATQELMKYVGFYSPLQTHLSYAHDSDYDHFQSNGDIITGLYEYNESNYPHTPNDTYANMDPVYVYNIAKASTGAMLHFTAAKTLSIQECTPEEAVKSMKIYPNPAKSFINIDFLNKNLKQYQFTLTDFSGKQVFKVNNTDKIDVSKLSKGSYIGTLTIDDQSNSKKILID